MDDSLKRNIAKIGMFAALSWIGYKIISGIASDKSSKEIVKETVAPITNAAAEVSKITKKFLKGTPEAKAHMAAIRSKIKPKTSKASAGEKGGEATAKLGSHKGHTTKKGLVQDQEKISKEVHEKHYRKNKVEKKNVKINSYADGGVVKETGLALVHKGEVVIPVSKCSYKGVCDRVRKDETGEKFWQEMMKNKVKVSEKEFLKNVSVKKILDEGETWKSYKSDQSEKLKFYKSFDGKVYFFQTSGFEFIWERK